MSTTREPVLAHWLITLLAGAVAALGLWLVAGEPEAAALGFVIAAVARDGAAGRGCVRRLRAGGR